MDLPFSKRQRVRKPGEYAAVFQARLYVADAWLQINGRQRPEGEGTPRLGLSIGKRFGNAVQRNRWKRVVREAFRLEQCSLPTDWDLIVRPQGNRLPSLEQARGSLKQLARRLGKKQTRSDR